MRKAINYKTKFVSLIERLYKDYPTYNIGRHLSTALDEYGDYWGLSDKELCFAIERYMELLALDGECAASPEYVENILRDANGLFYEELEDEDDEYDIID